MALRALNYTAFFTLYVICFAYLFRSNSGIIALGSLTILHSACTMFLGNEISNMLITPVNGPNEVITIVAMVAILLTMGMNAAALIIIMLMATALQKKYSDKFGTPFNLPEKEEDQFYQFKSIGLAVFIMTCVLLYLIVHRTDFNVQSSNYFKFFLILAFSSTIFGLSIKQVIHARQLSRLKDRVVI